MRPIDRQLQLVAAEPDEIRRGAGRNARLLRLLARIDLQIAARQRLPLGALGDQRARQLFPIDGLDHVEEGDRVGDLVGLQRTDEVELEIGKALLQRRIFPGRLLHAVFAEQAMAGAERRLDAIGPVRLADRDQRHRRGIASHRGGGGRDAPANLGQRGRNLRIGSAGGIGHEHAGWSGEGFARS